MNFLSIDFGTSGLKMSVLDSELNTLQWVKEEYPYILLPGEKAELSYDTLWGALVSGAKRIKPELLKSVDLVCYDTFSPSPVFLDADGEPVYGNIITHIDRRSRAQSKTIDRIIGKDRFLDITGIYPFAGGCSAMTLIWMAENEPDVLKKTARIGHLPTYIHKRMTGKWAVDLVNASMMGLFRTAELDGWSYDLIDAFGFKRDWFGEILLPGKIHGTLLPEVAQQLGLKSGIPVTIGTNDMAAAQIGAGNFTSGRIMETAGSSEMVSILTDIPKKDPRYYLRCSALPGLWQIYATTAGGFAVDWFRKELCGSMSKPEFYEFLSESLASGSGDVRFMPYLTGDRQSLRKKTGEWKGLTLAATRSQMLCAMMEAMQEPLMDAITRAEKILPLDKTIRITGGMVTDGYIEFKKKCMKGYDFLVVDDCPILGSAGLAKYYCAE